MKSRLSDATGLKKKRIFKKKTKQTKKQKNK
jgi:hypothetical protein